MFGKIAEFFIKNGKLTVVLVLVILITGFGSYLILPKQYNPTIVVPAFQIVVPAMGLDSKEISTIVVSPLENKIMELEGIDKVYGVAGDNYGAVMVKFKVGIDKEKAKIRLIQKIRENMLLKPLGVGKPIIKTIDPDELSQIVFSISIIPHLKKEGLGVVTSTEKYIYLRQIANIIKNKLKTVKNITTLEIVGGYKKDLVVELNLAEIESKNVDIMQVYESLEKNNLNLPSGDIITKSGNKIFVETSGKIKTKEELKKLIIGNFNGNVIYLEDIAKIKLATKRLDKLSNIYTKSGATESVFLGVGKALGTNAVFVTNDVIEKLEQIKKELPKNIDIKIISNEGEKANNATNMLLVNLVQSILIVFGVLALYLGVKNAFNTAVSIPLTLGMVFVFALIAGENINKITLFALILVLGMLVDNSTVVVENISRHLNDRIKTGKTKLEAVLEGTQEVGTGVVLSTLTRLLAFGSMFAVTGMMGEYMNPIPKFAIWALLISIAIAFTINPWVSYISAKDITESEKNKNNSEKESPLKIRKKYLKFMRLFLNNDKKSNKRRKIFKITFWLSLFIILVAPIYFGIFKARMLPKSNQNQVYLWIDTKRENSAEKTQEIEKYASKYLLEKDYIENITSTIGQAYIGDFANLFRGGSNRFGENQINLRINLVSPEKYKNKLKKSRDNSEKIVIDLRDKLRNHILEKYPDVKIQLLEDPPGPPVKATFLIKLKTDASIENKSKFINQVETQVRKISKKENIVDVYNSEPSTYKKLKINLDRESVIRAGLTIQQVEYTLGIILHGKETNLISDKDSFEPTNIIITTSKEEVTKIEELQNISFTNNVGEKIPLSSLANIEYGFVSPEINSDSREETTFIYGEMGDNSLIYPVIKLFGKFLGNDFTGENYKIKSWSLYYITYTGLQDGKDYVLEWGGEWELTMDTFRDLGIAMGISLLAIYFVLVGQFGSFGIAGVVMITFLLGFFGVWPGFTFLYLFNNEYFSATSMIGIIALAGIVVGNAIILIDYINVLKKNGLTLSEALLKAGYVRFAPIILTSLTTVFGAATIVGDPVWSGLAWAIIWGLSISSILTLIVIPIFYYESQKDIWK
ncbi:MAG: efflux RND transporter permease subunit [Candidatus Gracilibacteria bacterium]|nr:efflux RND transporter permease subunit [Candidatus Gracilibacteria bacterium]MDQ7023822.1 efflux RND transporter permease subunit [Candidatus Gracilibacteria bacterium]